MRKPSLTNFYILVQNYTAGKLAKFSLLPVFMLLMSISAFSQATQEFTCDDDCEGFLQVTLCIDYNSAAEPVRLSGSSNLFEKLLGSACPSLIESHGFETDPKFVLDNIAGTMTYCNEDLYVEYGATATFTIEDANGISVAGGSNGSFTAPDAPTLAIDAPTEACLGNEGDAVFIPSFTEEADLTDACVLTLDPTAGWISFMNVSDNPNATDASCGGGYCFGVFEWGADGTGNHPDLGAVFSGSTVTLTSPPLDDPSIYWYDSGMGGPGELGNNIMEANHFVEDLTGQYAGKEITYTVEVTANSFSCGQTTQLYIREFNAGFAGIAGENFTPICEPGIYTVRHTIGAGAIVQYGHQTVGPNVWSTDVAGCGSIQIVPTTLMTSSGTASWSVQDDSGMQIESGVALSNNKYSFAFAGEGDYNVELIYDDGSGCLSRTSVPFTVLDPSSASLDGDSYVCDTDLPSAYFLDFDGELDCMPTWTLTDASGTDVSSQLVAVGGEDYQISVDWPADAVDGSPYILALVCDGGTCNATPEPLEITFSDGTANQMACNNLVNITLNANCELILTPDMILEGGGDDEDQYSLVITDIETGEELPEVLDYSHVGNTYQVMVIEDCSNNSCWGFIRVEDKGIPALECPEDVIVECDEIDDLMITGLPIFADDVTLTQTSSDPVEFNVVGFDNCTDATLTFSDTITDESCEADEPGTTITRTFTITDQVGHTTSCDQMIQILRPEVSSIQAPPAYSNSIAGAEPAIDLCEVVDGQIALDENGNPHPSVTGFPTGVTCMNVSLNGYDDVIELPLCGPGSGAKKIIREWLVHNACTGEVTTLTQIIEIADDTPPATVCPADNIEIPADPYECGSEVELFPYPGSGGFGEIVALIECSEFTLEVFYKAALPGTNIPGNEDFTSLGFVDGPSDSVTIPATDGERVWITYVVEDACGNTAFAEGTNGAGESAPDQVSCFFEVDYIDVTPPQPVCDLYSVVSVGSDGCTLVGPQSFNDGSHDNCSDELTFAVQRMDDFTGSNYQEYVEFCCEDVSNSPIMVILNVTDEEGNSAQCMVEVTVDDNISPILQNCPSNETVDCEDSRLSNLSAFGAPTFTDNCSGTLTANPAVTTIDDCGFGTISRSWTLVDAAGNSGGTCTQVISVVNSSPFDGDNIDWPADTTIDCNASSDPSATGEPTVDEIGCSNVLFSFDDMQFESLSGNNYCQKILRHWSVIDWCNQGQTFTYTQVIRIEDNAIPSVSCPSADTSGDLNVGSCTKTVELVATGADNCTAPSDLVWFYTVDLGNDGSVDYSRSGSDATDNYPVGTHVVTFFAEDECSNVASCSVTVNINDDILPTPYCLSEVVTVLSAATGTAEIWAEDLNAGSFDNCFDGSASDVDISFSPTPGDLVRFFDCDDIPNGIVDTVSLNVYVIDEDGNSDFCTAMVIIQDNNDLCTDVPVDGGGDSGEPGDGEGEGEEGEGEGEEEGEEDPVDDDNGRISIKGDVATEGAAMLTDIMVRLQSSQPEFPVEMPTDVTGYEFADLTADESYMVQAEKNDNHANGVSTLDIILIQRHILNIQNLDSPYKLIAADANDSGDVSAADMVDIRKLILEIYSEYPNNTSWRFVNKDFVFTDATQPFPYEEEVNLVNQGTDAYVDFIGVKVGDVNQSVTINGVTSESVDTRGSKSLKLETAVREGANGQSYIDVIVTETSDVYGFQFALDANANISDVLSGTLQINENNINMTQSDRGLAMLSWNSTSVATLNEGDVLFTIEADASATGLDLDATLMSPEAYVLGDNDGIEITTVTIGASQAEATDFAVFQNKPNPFSELTTIGFTLPQTQSVTLKVMDVTGQVLYSLTDTYTKGTNEVLFDASLVNTTGILYYQIETDKNSSTKKMVILK